MDLYSKEQVANIHQETFAFLIVEEADNVLTVTLNRAHKKNALHPKMIDELAFAFQYAFFEKNIWVIIIKAMGDVFCAGADLKALRGDIELHNSTIPTCDKQILIGEVFNKVYKPVICQVEGKVFAGGFLILAGCQYVVAADHLEFGMPEVKRGIFPMQVMAALLKVMPQRKVIDWCIRGFTIPASTALEWGVLTHLTSKENVELEVNQIANELKENSPKAISLGLEALDHISSSEDQTKYLMGMLMKAIGSKDGQEGLRAFGEKRKAVWIGE